MTLLGAGDGWSVELPGAGGVLEVGWEPDGRSYYAGVFLASSTVASWECGSDDVGELPSVRELRSALAARAVAGDAVSAVLTDVLLRAGESVWASLSAGRDGSLRGLAGAGESRRSA